MPTMTISQGLRAVKKLKGQLAETLERAQRAVTYRKEQEPAFKFPAMIEMANGYRNQLVELESRIACTNATTKVDCDGQTVALASVIRQLQELKGQIAWYKGLTVRARAETVEDETEYNDEGKRFSKKAIWACDLPESEQAARVDQLQTKFDRLNDLVEKTNHVTELVT